LKRKVLFVDDEPKVLQGLQRMLRNMRNDWEMEFAENAIQALEILNGRQFDVVVADMRMPGLDGCRLLGKVKGLYPQIVRIILSGYSDREMILNSVRIAHQYLSKPCDADVLKSTISRACALRDLLTDESLISLISRIDSLPSLPSLYSDLLAELESPDASIQKVGEIIAKDIAMTAKILHLANSAFFGIGQHVANIHRALNCLGMETVKALVITVHIFSEFRQAAATGFPLSALWDHCMATGIFAKAIAREAKQDLGAVGDTFMSGLLHDVGKLVLAVSLPERYCEVLTLVNEAGKSYYESELEVFGTTHAQVGAYLMGLWGLADPIVEAIAFHHVPSECPISGFNAVTAVHVADALDNVKCSDDMEQLGLLLDLGHLEDLKLADRLVLWKTICHEEMAEKVDA
jgi:HD-like signal output (HDOD) protein/CheY-like chemotaxis protein